ncbi:hypothetical protein RQP46_003934 [Phenoliferia psychrophenolica]
MPPAARLSLAWLPSRLPNFGPSKFRVQGWDPILIISQIVSLQALHYLSLSFLLPPLLSLFASPTLLSYEGGPSSISMVMDWREFSGLSTVSLAAAKGAPGGLIGLAAAAKAGGQAAISDITIGDLARGLVRVVEGDPMRGWVVALGWVLASLLDVVFLYHLIRRPTHILDFSLTLVFNHLILTTYYSSSFPSSVFFWFIIATSSVAQIVLAEQCCVSREMNEGFSVDSGQVGWNTPAVRSSSTMEGGGRGRDELEMGAVTKGGERGTPGPGYERLPAEERNERQE